MALKPSLSVISRRIGQAVKKAAANYGLLPGNYVLAGTYDEDSDRINLALGTVQSVDERGLYSAIRDEIRSAVPEIPGFTYHVGLVIRYVENLDQIYFESSSGAEHELDLSDMFARA